ncbi:glycoside hydrolase family 88 protein [Sinomicrobium weinanense]|uniref:Glycoside hydrolase family 88 protein n=1 Tax=Sinomicrobium weinanense TaxID=2842200 RepID=A0A926JUS7_9FLAO|nr:glycoside hydrolase family 88 protein [Sinomicrobium weinanense]MBC9797746.1 glycoside hydrolase family 88 protein [Sinomicrobium weinanense]MBU3125989.1 glycoside hydrolase family 88 protein [Sinomicrobium weinanense]
MKRKVSGVWYVLAGLLFLNSCKTSQRTETATWLEKSVKTATHQLTRASEEYSPGMNPRSVEPDGSVRLAPANDWTTGFFPGSLWLGYEISGKKVLKQQAERFTLALDTIKDFKYTHDLGFMLFCSYGNAYRITRDKKYLPVLRNGAANLYSRYNEKVGSIRSWDFGEWQYPVIIDNMMNLELLYWASDKFKKPVYARAAESHAMNSLRDHYREDHSSYHVVSYDTLSGKPVIKETHQGYGDETAWARGQAWGLYGFSMSYKNTGEKKFIEQAEHIARFIMNHPRLPKDKIPYWDYDAPDIPGAPRDASAAAITASALLELSTQVKDGSKYFAFAEDILKSLSSDIYLARPDSAHFFILNHSVGALPNNSEVDTPINYADYYFLEALDRYARLKNIDLKKI